MSLIDLSIITVGYSSQKILPALLASIKQQEGCVLEFIYVENAPHDSSCQIVREHFPAAKIIEPGVNLGFSKGCNLGASVAKGAYLFFLNPDCEIKTVDTLKKMIQFMQDRPDVGICAPMYVNSKGKLSSGAFSGYISDTLFSNDFNNLPGNIAWVTGAAMIIPRPIFRLVCGFDERYFMYSEDMDICLSVRKAGYIIAEVSGTRMYHKGGRSSKKLWKKNEVYFRMEVSSAMFTEKNYGVRKHKLIWKQRRLRAIYKLIKSCLVHPLRISLYLARFRAANAVCHRNKFKVS